MNAIVSTTVVAADVELIPLADLYLSPLNPRQHHEPGEVELMAESLIACGMLQNLGGLRDADGKVGIVYGGRRLAGAKIAVGQRPDLSLVQVRMAPDEKTALEWAAVENTARKDLPIVREIRSFAQMREAGSSVPQIARAFAVTEAHVYRRLKLADLPGFVLDALDQGVITLGIASTFTLANDLDHARVVLDRIMARPGDYSEHQVRKMMQPLAVASNDRRAVFVGEAAYTEAGGRITRDLFSSTVLFEDVDLLDELFAAKLEDMGRATAEEGWAWGGAETQTRYDSYDYDQQGYKHIWPEPGDLTEEEAEQYDELAELANADALDEEGHQILADLEAKQEGGFTAEQKAVAGVVVFVDQQGELRRKEGVIRPEDIPAAIEAGVLTAPRARTDSAEPSAPAMPKSPYSGALVDDMKAVRLAAVQTALLDKPELVLDLLAFGLSMASGVNTTVFDLSPGRPTNCPGVAEGLDFPERLTHLPAGHEAWNQPELKVDNLDEAFRDFAAKGKKARNAALVEGIARTLPYGAGNRRFFALIEADSGAGIRKVWTPTAANFFGRVPGDYLDDLLADLLDLAGGDPRLKGFRSKKKKEKAEAMERLFSDPEYQAAMGVKPEQKARIAAWVPDCF